jgi:hypothetical protein
MRGIEHAAQNKPQPGEKENWMKRVTPEKLMDCSEPQ